MALPVILTNASGTTEYLTRKNSLPLGFTRTHADGKVGDACTVPVPAFVVHTTTMCICVIVCLCAGVHVRADMRACVRACVCARDPAG